MKLENYFKSVIDHDTSPIVICDTEDIIIYMNPSAVERYKKRGGAELIGKNLLNCHNDNSVKIIKKITDGFKTKSIDDIYFTYHNKKDNCDVFMVALRDRNGELIGYYEKHESRNLYKSVLPL